MPKHLEKTLLVHFSARLLGNFVINKSPFRLNLNIIIVYTVHLHTLFAGALEMHSH